MRFPLEDRQFERWLSDMQQHYELVGREHISFPRLRKDDRTLVTLESIDSYKFVPRDPSSESHSAPPLVDLPSNRARR